jgi:hypothetical protein
MTNTEDLMLANRYLITTLAIAAIAIGGCGHTNNLAKYTVVGRTALFRAAALGGAATSYVAIESPTDHPVGGLAAVVGSIAVGERGRARIERAVNGDSIAAAVGSGIRQTTTDYLGLQPVASMADDPAFIVETSLSEYALVSTVLGVCIRVTGESRVIDRASGGIVWEDRETHTIPLSQTYVASAAPRIVRSGASIYNAVDLLTLTDEELQRLVSEAAREAGREIGEELREDIADLREQ